MTREIQAAEAKIHLAQLLDEVEGGATLIITRQGRRMARIVLDVDRRSTGLSRPSLFAEKALVVADGSAKKR